MKIILSILAFVIIFFFAVKIVKDIKSYDYIGRDVSAPNTISVSGKGEILTKADIANFSFNVTEESINVSEAQEKASLKMSKIVEFLKDNEIKDGDIKTINYNIYPRYEYVKSPESIKTPTGNRRVLIGYEVSQGVEVKVRNIDSVGVVLGGIGALGANNISGLSFSIDDEESLKENARRLAIDDAKKNAEILADNLGVKLVRIVNFSESGYSPMYREKFSAEAMTLDFSASGGPVPEIPTGENEIISQVNIVYEIR